MVKEADFKHNGKISFGEFQQLMRDEVPDSPMMSSGKGSPLMRKKTGALDGALGEGGKGSPFPMRKRTGSLLSPDSLTKSPSRKLKRRPSAAFTHGTNMLPIQLDDRSVQLGAPSPLMVRGRKSIKTSPAEKRLWEAETIPDPVVE